MNQDIKVNGMHRPVGQPLCDTKHKRNECNSSLEDRLFLAVFQGDATSVQSLLKKGANLSAVCSSGQTPLGAASRLGNIEILKMLLESSISLKSSKPNKISSPSNRTRRGQEEIDSGSVKTSRKYCPADKRDQKCRQGRFSSDSKCPKKYSSHTSDDGKLSSDDEHDFNADINLYKSSRIQVKKTHVRDRQSYESTNCKDIKGCNSSSECSDETSCDLKKGNNQGYFIMVHSDCDRDRESGSMEDYAHKPHEDVNLNSNHKEDSGKHCTEENINEPSTPEGMDNLEWDSELHQENEHYSLDEDDEEESDSWVKLYRWYADYLARSCVVDPTMVQQCDVNQVDLYGRGALHYAAEQGHMDVLLLLIDSGCHVDMGDSDDLTPLHLAAARDYPEAVSLLISSGASVNRMSMDRTGPLHMAAARGYMQTARTLLEHGANVNALDRSDRSPLMLAVARGLVDMVDLLIHHGAKVNVEEIHGYTPLCQAVWQQQEELVRLLLSAGAKLTQSDHLLHHAILHRHADIAKLLLGAGSIVNLRDDNGDTPLIIAVRSGQVDIAELLLKNGAIANYPNGLTGSTPLHEAVESLRPAQYPVFREILLTLLKYGAHLNLESSAFLDTPITRALVHDKDRAMVILIQYGADVNLLQQHTLIVDHKYLTRRPDRWPIAQLMVHAGLDLWRLVPEIQYGEHYQPNSPATWISQMKFNPMTLAGQTRLCIRRHFGKHIYRTVRLTDLPTRLKRYVMLEDIVCVEDL